MTNTDKNKLLAMGRVMKAARAMASMSQSQLAKAIKSSQNHLSNLESGNRVMDVLLAHRIATVLGIDCGNMIAGKLTFLAEDKPS